jgi:UDP-glucuronate 4-epimerase
MAGRPISVFGQGQMARDFTYIDDIVDGIVGLIPCPPPGKGAERHQVYNIGDSQPVGLLKMIEILEQAIGIPAKKVFKDMQAGDVTATYADISKIAAVTGYHPTTSLEVGLPQFVDWYRRYTNRA